MVLQEARRTYSENRPNGIKPEVSVKEEEEKREGQLQAFTEWFEKLDHNASARQRVRIPFPMSDPTRKELEALGIKLFYHHSSYSWLLDLHGTLDSGP